MIPLIKLKNMEVASQLLYDPAPEVVQELIAEIYRLRELLEDRHFDFEEDEIANGG